MLVLEFPLALRKLVIKVCQRVLWVKCLGSWDHRQPHTLQTSPELFRQAQFMGCNDESGQGVWKTAEWGILSVCCICWGLSTRWHCEETTIPADLKRWEEREKSWPTVLGSVMSKLYESGLVSITLSWTSFKWCECLYWAAHNRDGM